MMQNSSESELDESCEGSRDSTENPTQDLVTVQGDKCNIMEDSNAAFVVLLNTFEYLTCYDLVRASRVSKIWNYVASHNIFWKDVKLVRHPHDCDALGQKLWKHGTQSLDISRLRFDHRFVTSLCSAPSSQQIFTSLLQVKTLTKIKLGFSPPDVFTMLSLTMPQLKSISLSCFSIEFKNIRQLKNLEELELTFKNKYPFFPICDLKSLETLKSLKRMSLRRLDLIGQEINHFPPCLESLVFGRCIRLPDNFPKVITTSFLKLKRLRLEDCHEGSLTTKIVTAVSMLPNLKQLELINFRIETGFQTALANCTQLETLLIIPPYQVFYESLKAHQIAIEGVIKLKETLKKFVLGYCLELLSRVDTVHLKKIHHKSYAGKFLTATVAIRKSNCKSAKCRRPSHVEVISINLCENEMLEKCLPKTTIKILEIPASKIWDQTV